MKKQFMEKSSGTSINKLSLIRELHCYRTLQKIRKHCSVIDHCTNEIENIKSFFMENPAELSIKVDLKLELYLVENGGV